MLAQDTDTQTGCAAALRANGFEVETVRKDGAQILRLFRQGSRPDVLIMDAFMQGTDAIGVLGGLADMHLEPRPLVFVTASNANPRLEQEITQSGADYYFIKPFDTQILAQRIKQLTGLSAPAQGNIVAFSAQDNSLEVTVSEIMHRIGVPAHIKGYQYLREAIILAVNDDEIMNSVTKLLYPTVARPSKPLRRALNAPFATQSRSPGTEAMSMCSTPISATPSRTPAASRPTANSSQ